MLLLLLLVVVVVVVVVVVMVVVAVVIVVVVVVVVVVAVVFVVLAVVVIVVVELMQYNGKTSNLVVDFLGVKLNLRALSVCLDRRIILGIAIGRPGKLGPNVR